MTTKFPRLLLQVLLVPKILLQKWQVLIMNIPRKSPVSWPSMRQLGQLGWHHFPIYQLDRVWDQVHFFSYQSSVRPFLYQAPIRHFNWLTRIWGHKKQKLSRKHGRVLPWFQAAFVARVPVKLTCHPQSTMANWERERLSQVSIWT